MQKNEADPFSFLVSPKVAASRLPYASSYFSKLQHIIRIKKIYSSRPIIKAETVIDVH
jgi:hypothetical protein